MLVILFQLRLNAKTEPQNADSFDYYDMNCNHQSKVRLLLVLVLCIPLINSCYTSKGGSGGWSLGCYSWGEARPGWGVKIKLISSDLFLQHTTHNTYR